MDGCFFNPGVDWGDRCAVHTRHQDSRYKDGPQHILCQNADNDTRLVFACFEGCFGFAILVTGHHISSKLAL